MLLNYRKNGTPFWNLLSIEALRDKEGSATAYLGTQKDVTELVRFWVRWGGAGTATAAALEMAFHGGSRP